MGTHPIFESDFDCLTECPSTTVSGIKLKFRMTKMTHILTSTLHRFSSGDMRLESSEWTKWQKKKRQSLNRKKKRKGLFQKPRKRHDRRGIGETGRRVENQRARIRKERKITTAKCRHDRNCCQLDFAN